jgi:hypothetical protein
MTPFLQKLLIRPVGDTTPTTQGVGGFFERLFRTSPFAARAMLRRRNSGIVSLLPPQLDRPTQAPPIDPIVDKLDAANQLPSAGQLGLAGLTVPQALAGLTPEQIEELRAKGTLNGMPTTVGAAFQQATSATR